MKLYTVIVVWCSIVTVIDTDIRVKNSDPVLTTGAWGNGWCC